MNKQAYLEQKYNSAFQDELEKISGVVKIPEGGLRQGWLYNDVTQTMTPDDANRVKKNTNIFMRSGPGILPLAAAGAGVYSGISKLLGSTNKTAIMTGAAGAVALPLISYLSNKEGLNDENVLKLSRDLVNKANRI